MAVSLTFASPFLYTSRRLSPATRVQRAIPKISGCNSITQSLDWSITSRSENYHHQILDYNCVQSLTSNYVGESNTRRANMLKEEVRMLIEKVEEPLIKLELIDTIQRLGISYHFEDEIKKILTTMYNNNCTSDKKEDLYATSLRFRILRQHGYYVPQDVFCSFKDESGNFKATVCEDTKGMLYLYEASYLSIGDESILDEARNFTTQQLKENLKNKMDPNLAILVSHALELPLNLRMLRLEARWFIDVYERRSDINTTLLELAKLDFNMVQATHQEDLKYLSRWWKGTCLGDKLSFARDNLTENFFWTVGIIFEPQFQYCRRIITKLSSLYTVLDDFYDEYGTLQELEIFTNAVERWDINEIEQLPNNIKLCFLALYNSTNEMVYDVHKEQDYHIISYLKNAWADLCKSYLQEAKWYYNKERPTFKDYVKNAWISIGAPLVLVHAYFCLTKPIKKEALDCLQKYPNFIQSSAIIMRLLNDLGPSKDELKIGDNPKSIQCYMYETGGSKEAAREHIKHLINENWKKMNECQFVESPFDQIFVKASMNLTRMALVMYQNGDGHGLTHTDVNRVVSLLINPIPM